MSLRERRKGINDASQQELASYLGGVSRQFISQVERGVRPLPARLDRKLAQIEKLLSLRSRERRG